MAKELPYFKFEPSQWENGNIQMCSKELQGIFISVCSIYWQRLGDLSYALAMRKVCDGNATALESLCEAGVLRITDGEISIDFLDEQLSEFENTSKVNSENARLGWEKRKKTKKNATPLRPHSDRNAIREEKRREEESKYTTQKQAHDDISNNYKDISTARTVLANRGWRAATDDDVGALLYHFLETQIDLNDRPKKDVRQHFQNWINKKDIDELTKLTVSIRAKFQRLSV